MWSKESEAADYESRRLRFFQHRSPVLTACCRLPTAYCSFHPALLAPEEVDQDELREVAGRGEVRLARGHGGHLLDELDEVVVRGEHEGVDLDARLAAGLDFAEGRVHHDG